MRAVGAIIVCAAVAAGLIWRYAMPHLPHATAKRLAPEGTFFLTERISKQVDYGIYSLPAGSKVHRVSQNGELLTVSDGRETFELVDAQLTNDLDLGVSLAANENENQSHIDSAIETDRRKADEKKRREDLESAQKMEEHEKKRKEGEKSGSTILSRPAYNQTDDVTGKTIYIDKYGRRFWVDTLGGRHYL